MYIIYAYIYSEGAPLARVRATRLKHATTDPPAWCIYGCALPAARASRWRSRVRSNPVFTICKGDLLYWLGHIRLEYILDVERCVSPAQREVLKSLDLEILGLLLPAAVGCCILYNWNRFVPIFTMQTISKKVLRPLSSNLNWCFHFDRLRIYQKADVAPYRATQRTGASMRFTTLVNRHLGLIDAPPLILFFLQTTFFTIHLLLIQGGDYSSRPLCACESLATTYALTYDPSRGTTRWLSIYLSIYLSLYLSLSLYIYIYIYIYVSIYVCMYVCMYVCIYIYIYIYIYMYACLTLLV